MTTRSILTPVFALTAFGLCGPMVLAQQPPVPPTAPSTAPVERQMPPGPAMRPGMRQGIRPGVMPAGRMGGRYNGSGSVHGNFHGSQGSGMETGFFHIAPLGMWWRNSTVVQRLTLTPDQVKRMDGIFQESRIQLIDLKANVEKQNAMLEPLLSANPPDTTKTLAQIDKVAAARADLEKADAKMLLGIREVLTPDQWTKLNERPAAGGSGTSGYGAGRGRRGGPGSNAPGPPQ